nr:TD and POZ domain-containing protein 4-like [Parasteatoda tepidariorum]
MSNETGKVFKFDWKIGFIWKFINRAVEYEKTSPIVVAKQLNGTKWYLRMYRNQSSLPGGFTCCLCRENHDSKSENISVTYKLELIDMDGKVFKSVMKENITFSKKSSSEVDSFLDSNTVKLLIRKYPEKLTFSTGTLRCHIFDASYKKQVITVGIPTVIHAQWKIDIPGPENWMKKVKVPFHECTHIDIIMQDSYERINMKIEKVDSLQPYKMNISILSAENRKIDCELSKKAVENQKFETWIEKSQLVDKSCFHLPYSFTLVCFITTSDGNSDSIAENGKLEDSSPSLKASPLTLQKDLKKMLLNDKHSDVKLKTRDKIIAAHKCLLSARSPVFATMFNQDMLETQTGVVDTLDVESYTLQSFLEFLYTDTITDADCEEVLKLMLVADKYQVDNLKERCSQILTAKLSVGNICHVISVAERVNQPVLKLSAFDFIRANKREILSSSVWSKWMKENMELANDILLKMIVD